MSENNEPNNGNDANGQKYTDTPELPVHLLRQIAERLEKDVDAWCVETMSDSYRTHLGASKIGQDCLQASWLAFRWAAKESVGGRMLRLFQRGHDEESKVVRYLEGIGCTVWTRDEHGNQFNMSGVGGHYGGSIDGVVRLPPEYGIDEPMLLEVKTSGTGAGFNKYAATGMALNKPVYYAQQSSYGVAWKFRYAVFVVVNKNDDSMYWEVVKLDARLGQQCTQKAEKIIWSQSPMPMISKSPASKVCSTCEFKDNCHSGKLPDKNCRSCSHCSPQSGKMWRCELFDASTDDKATLLAGCDKWSPIINGG